MNLILTYLDSIIYFIMLVTVLYLLVYAVASQRKRDNHYSKSKKINRIVVFLPSYKEDRVIISSVESIIKQDYPKELFDVVVISDRMKEETNQTLLSYNINVVKVNFENSSKAKALNFALDSLQDTPYDIAVILDADNTTDTDFLTNINNTYSAGIMAIQAHRVAKNRNTDTAVLDAVSEEINNSIFRKGHVNLGISSALIGSGMAFDYKWFKTNMKEVSSVGEDKELEILLLKQNIYIEYLEDVLVYDEKTQSTSNFYKQRRRWLAAQFDSLATSLKYLPKAISTQNIDLCDKVIQWMMLPRSIVFVVITFMALLLTLFNWIYSIKWWILLFTLLFTISSAIPNYLVDDKFKKAVRKIPILAFMMIINMLRLRGASKKFIHTDHSHEL